MRERGKLIRERKPKARAAGVAAFDADFTGHALREVFDDREAQTGAAHVAAASRIHAVESFEDTVPVLLRNPLAVVLDLDADFIVDSPSVKTHATSFGCVLDSVFDQVAEDLIEGLSIGENVEFLIEKRLQVDPAGVRAGEEALDRAVERFADGDAA